MPRRKQPFLSPGSGLYGNQTRADTAIAPPGPAMNYNFLLIQESGLGFRTGRLPFGLAGCAARLPDWALVICRLETEAIGRSSEICSAISGKS